MPDMTLQEALQTPEVQGFIGAQIRESVDEVLGEKLGTAVTEAVTTAVGDAVKAALDEQVPTIRESVREELQQGQQVRGLHTEALRLIEASPLKGAAKANLLDDYSLTEDGDKLKPGRALALVEAVVDGDGKVTKTAKDVLRDTVDADIKRARNVLREAAPTVPYAPGGGVDGGETQAAPFLGESSPVAQRMREKGLDPGQFGATPQTTPTT